MTRVATIAIESHHVNEKTLFWSVIKFYFPVNINGMDKWLHKYNMQYLKCFFLNNV